MGRKKEERGRVLENKLKVKNINMYANKEKESRARIVVRASTAIGEELNEDTVKAVYLRLGGLYREEEVMEKKVKKEVKKSK